MTSDSSAVQQRRGISLQALDHLDQAITVIDDALRLVSWNRSFLQLLDFPQELVHYGVTLEALIRYNVERGEYGPGDPEQQVSQRIALARGFEPHRFERIRPNGIVLEIQGNPVSGLGFVTTYTDITDRKRAEQALIFHHRQLEARVEERTASLKRLNTQLIDEVSAHKQTEQALRENEQWIRLITDAVPALIAYVGSDLKYQFVNQGHEDLLGLSPFHLMGKDVFSVFGAEQQSLGTHINRALSGLQTHLDLELDDQKETTRYFRVSLIPHRDEEESVIGFFFLGQDLTDYKTAQHALYQAQKMQAVGQLTGGIAHDFNNLLTIISGNLEFLAEFLPEDAAEDIGTLQACQNAARRGAELTNRLLAFSRQHPLDSCAVDVKVLLADTKDLLKRTLGEGTQLELSVPENVWYIQVDPGQLEVSLLNLALNARDAMPRGGVIKIRCRNVHISSPVPTGHTELTPGEYVLINLLDNGSGMAANILPRVFEPFFTTKSAESGSGLGLSMVYGFALQSGGHIGISSQPGRGTSVSLYLPRSTGAPKSHPPDEHHPTEIAGSGTLLLVEDDTDIQRFIKRILDDSGFRVIQASNATEALEIYRQEGKIDLLLTDISMPGAMDGTDLARQLTRIQPMLNVIFMSGYIDKIQHLEETTNSNFQLLRKPFSKTQLAMKIRQIQKSRVNG